MSSEYSNTSTPSPFIWGTAITEAGISEHEYLIHTQYPRFIVTVHDEQLVAIPHVEFKSLLGLHPDTTELVYVTEFDLAFKDWVFLDSGEIDFGYVKAICDEATLNYMLRNKVKGRGLIA